MSSVRVNEPIKIYKYQDLYYYFKTKKPCKVQDQNIIDVQNGKYSADTFQRPVYIIENNLLKGHFH